ncbi:hypothetical protein JCM11491_004012 [Sporobolomyces phaffii]
MPTALYTPVARAREQELDRGEAGCDEGSSGLRNGAEPRQKRWKISRVVLALVVVSVLVGTVSWSHDPDSSSRWRIAALDSSHRDHQPLNLSLIINYPTTPQDSLSSQLKPGVRYITALSYGGHANQFIGIQNLLYLGKVLNRVAIIPTLTPLHFRGLPQDMSRFYDLQGFYESTAIPAVELSTLKWWNFTAPPPVEPLSCWSVLEQVADGRNINDGSMAVHNIDVKYYPLPVLSRATEDSKIWFESIHEFDSNPWAKQKWIDRVRDELLPHAKPSDDVQADVAPTLKPGFDPRNTDPPAENLLCLDTTFFLAARMFPPAFPASVPAEPFRFYEDHAWIQAGQYLRFSTHLEALADRYLQSLFGISNIKNIPPFITCHIRRGDFAEARGLTSIDKYTDAVRRVRDKLDWRREHPDGWTGPGKGNERFVKGLRGAQYPVVVATDEAPGSDFVKMLREDLGWKVIDHDFMNTEDELGGWYPLLIDSVILSRGQGFVGTEFSTFSFLAGLRVK